MFVPKPHTVGSESSSKLSSVWPGFRDMNSACADHRVPDCFPLMDPSVFIIYCICFYHLLPILSASDTIILLFAVTLIHLPPLHCFSPSPSLLPFPIPPVPVIPHLPQIRFIYIRIYVNMGAKATVHKPPSDFFVCHTYTPRTNGKVIALHFTAVSLRQVLIRFCIIREQARRNSFWHCCGRHFIGFHNTYIMQGHNRGSFYRDYVTRQSARKGAGV